MRLGFPDSCFLFILAAIVRDPSHSIGPSIHPSIWMPISISSLPEQGGFCGAWHPALCTAPCFPSPSNVCAPLHLISHYNIFNSSLLPSFSFLKKNSNLLVGVPFFCAATCCVSSQMFCSCYLVNVLLSLPPLRLSRIKIHSDFLTYIDDFCTPHFDFTISCLDTC